MTDKHYKVFALIVVLMIVGVMFIVGTSGNKRSAAEADEATTNDVSSE